MFFFKKIFFCIHVFPEKKKKIIKNNPISRYSLSELHSVCMYKNIARAFDSITRHFPNKNAPVSYTRRGIFFYFDQKPIYITLARGPVHTPIKRYGSVSNNNI